MMLVPTISPPGAPAEHFNFELESKSLTFTTLDDLSERVLQELETEPI